MSLVSTYVLMEDGLINNGSGRGRWYKNPILYNRPNEGNWFICYDDDDPIELVVEESLFNSMSGMHKLLENLREIGYDISFLVKNIKWSYPSGRLHGNDTIQFDEYIKSYSCFINKHLHAPKINLGLCEIRYNAVYDNQPKEQGIYY